MSNKRIRAAIEGRLSTWAGAHSPALPIAWEDVPFTPSNAVYLRGFLLPATTRSDDLGGEHRQWRGFYQISLVCPINTGPGVAEGIAEELDALFPVNLLLPIGGLSVQIVSPASAAPALQDVQSYTIPVSLGYSAQTYLTT